MAKGMCYGLLEGVFCDSRTAQTSTLAASIVGEKVLLHDGSGRPPESSLALFIGLKYFSNDLAEESHDMINNKDTWLT